MANTFWALVRVLWVHIFSSGGSNESADTPFCPVSAAQVPQEVHGLHLLITGADAVGGTSQPIKIHAVWSTREWSTRVKICPALKLYYMSDVIVTKYIRVLKILAKIRVFPVLKHFLVTLLEHTA